MRGGRAGWVVALVCWAGAAAFGGSRSLSLDGSGDLVAVPRGASLQLDKEVTVEAEFLFQPAGGWLPLLSNHDPRHSSRGNYCLQVLRAGDTFAVEFGFEPVSVTDHIYRTKPAKGRKGFNRVAATFRYGKGSSMKVYLNGQPLEGRWVQRNGEEKPRRNDGPLLIGSAAMGLRGYWKGNIRRVAIWNVVRSQADLGRPPAGNEPGLAGYWTLETDAKDSTMNQNDGRLHGDATFGPEQKPAEPPPLRPVRNEVLRLALRSRVQPFKGADEWHPVVVREGLPVAETALLLCDVWDKHWCAGANRRLAAMLPRMNQVVRFAREHGVQIVHAPSGTMGFYANTPQRLRAQAAPYAKPPKPLELPDPPLPVDASDGGCDCQPKCRSHSAWKRQHPAIDIAEPDAISDNGQEVYNLLQQLGVKNLIIMGVHTNMCVLGRSFAIKPMTRWGVRCILVRDLTDTMYNPRRPPHVAHEWGTELVVEYIETHWCPSVLSDDLLKATPPTE